MHQFSIATVAICHTFHCQKFKALIDFFASSLTSPKPRCQQSCVPSGGSRGNLFPYPFQFIESICTAWLMAAVFVRGFKCLLLLSHLSALPFCPPLSLLKAHVITLGPPNNLCILESIILIPSAKSLVPCKLTFRVCGLGYGHL